MKINIAKNTETAIIPTHGTVGAAGYDLYGDNEERIIIQSQTNRMIDTSIIFEIPEGYFGAVFPRSGISTKRGGRLSNCVAVIDSDYRDSIKISLYNDSNVDLIIEPHERIAQIVILPYQTIDFNLCTKDELSNTDRGIGGFGSTGVK